MPLGEILVPTQLKMTQPSPTKAPSAQKSLLDDDDDDWDDIKEKDDDDSSDDDDGAQV